MSKKIINWDGIDWALNNVQIAEKLGISYTAVRTKRKSLGLEAKRRGRPNVTSPVYDLWDWTKSDKQLSMENNISAQRINWLRKRLNKPKSAKIKPEKELVVGA